MRAGIVAWSNSWAAGCASNPTSPRRSAVISSGACAWVCDVEVAVISGSFFWHRIAGWCDLQSRAVWDVGVEMEDVVRVVAILEPRQPVHPLAAGGFYPRGAHRTGIRI